MEKRHVVELRIVNNQIDLSREKIKSHRILKITGVCQIMIKPINTITRILRIGCVAWQNRSQTRQIYIPGKRVILLKLYKSQNINPISPTPKFTLGIIQIIVAYQLVSSA